MKLQISEQRCRLDSLYQGYIHLVARYSSQWWTFLALSTEGGGNGLLYREHHIVCLTKDQLVNGKPEQHHMLPVQSQGSLTSWGREPMSVSATPGCMLMTVKPSSRVSRAMMTASASHMPLSEQATAGGQPRLHTRSLSWVKGVCLLSRYIVISPVHHWHAIEDSIMLPNMYRCYFAGSCNLNS